MKKIRTLPAVRVTPPEYDAVMKISHSKDVPIAEVVRLAILEYCKENSPPMPDEVVLGELSEVAQKLASADLQEILEYAKYRLEKGVKGK